MKVSLLITAPNAEHAGLSVTVEGDAEMLKRIIQLLESAGFQVS